MKARLFAILCLCLILFIPLAQSPAQAGPLVPAASSNSLDGATRIAQGDATPAPEQNLPQNQEGTPRPPRPTPTPIVTPPPTDPQAIDLMVAFGVLAVVVVIVGVWINRQRTH